MNRSPILVFLISILFTLAASGQVRIRLFSQQTTGSVLFLVNGGKYAINTYSGENLYLEKNETAVINRFNGKLAVKIRSGVVVICDSLSLTGITGKDLFSLRINNNAPVRQNYSGDLKCFADLGTIVLINICDIESYIAGVVKAEGGTGRNSEYIRTQAILARTYMYKYMAKHLPDRYNVCDNTHCQAFNGLSGDSLINRAVRDTKGLVILDHDSSLIISAFHSNCGGMTVAPEDVWLTDLPYLKSVPDHYCLESRNALWKVSISLKDWINFLIKNGFDSSSFNASSLIYNQKTRQKDYVAGNFRMPLSLIRSEFNLRSTYFSVGVEGDYVNLSGRGYGHGVGLCQEGAMVMAGKGMNYTQIIGFYFNDIIITDFKNAAVDDRYDINIQGGL